MTAKPNTPSFSRPQEFIITSTQSINLFLAGIGSGKTYIIGFLSGYYVERFPGVPGFIGANTYMQLSQSTLLRVFKVWEELFNWVEGRDYVVNKRPPKSFKVNHNIPDYRNTISFNTGALVFTGSLDNAKAHDGKEFAWAFLDETKDSREEDVKDVILARLRAGGIHIDHKGQLTNKTGVKGRPAFEAFNPLYILTSPAKVAWINDWFQLDDFQEEILRLIFDKEKFFTKEFGDKSIVISSTYHNERNLPKGYIRMQTENRTEENAKMIIYGNPFVRTGGEFYSGFQRLKHVKEIPVKENLPFHISFDQNVNPYITATLYQVLTDYPSPTDGKKKTIINQFDEICLPNPRNTTAKLCLEFIKRYGTQVHGLYYYGDPSGKKSDTRGGEHDYKIVDRVLRKYLNNRSNRVPYTHPRVLKRRDFANNLFEGVYQDYEFFINSKCKKSIADFEFLKEDANGKKLKETAKDPVTGVRYEKYGHTSDSFDYFITQILKALFNKHFK